MFYFYCGFADTEQNQMSPWMDSLHVQHRRKFWKEAGGELDVNGFWSFWDPVLFKSDAFGKRSKWEGRPGATDPNMIILKSY